MSHGHDGSEPTVAELLRTAFVNGDEPSLSALVAAGPAAVQAFKAFLTRELDLSLHTGRPLVDNITAASCELASAFPDEYLDAFNSSSWSDNTYALAGLGCTGRREARPILAEALSSGPSWSVRQDAAVALRYIPGPESVKALVRALDDPHHLVQYSALLSLAEIGDKSALSHIIPLQTSERRSISDAATDAVNSIRERLGLEDEVHQ